MIIYCVNDGAVMDAWAEDQGVDQKGGFITMMGDPSGKVTRALGMVLDHPGPMAVLGYERCKRFAMYIEDGVIKVVHVAEKGPAGEDDPAGDDCAQRASPLNRQHTTSHDSRHTSCSPLDKHVTHIDANMRANACPQTRKRRSRLP